MDISIDTNAIKILPRYRVTEANKIVINNKHRNNKQKTTEQYKEEVAVINKNIEVLEDYINAKTKILHKCLLCQYCWYATPSNILKGRSCPKCANKITKTTEEYKKELYIINPNIDIIDEYMDSKTKITHKCKICSFEWKASPSNILHGTGCPNCANKKRNKNRQPSQEEYIKMLGNKNKTLTVIGLYINMNEKIEHLCLLCGEVIFMTPEHALRGYGCKKCSVKNTAQKLRLSPEKFKENLYIRNKNIELLTDYMGDSCPISCKCKICGHVWTVKMPFQLYTSNCPKCAIKEKAKKNTKTHDDFKNVILPNITLLSEYLGSNEKIDCLCDICGYKWTVNQANSLRRHGCPNCNKSHGERKIKTYLENHNLKYEQQKKYDDLVGVGLGLLSYDFFLSEYNLLIEFQGKQHKCAVEYFGGVEQYKKQQNHDKRKRQYAKKHNINLLEIWYYDIEKIEEILDEYFETLNNLKLESVETTGVA